MGNGFLTKEEQDILRKRKNGKSVDERILENSGDSDFGEVSESYRNKIRHRLQTGSDPAPIKKEKKGFRESLNEMKNGTPPEELLKEALEHKKKPENIISKHNKTISTLEGLKESYNENDITYQILQETINTLKDI